MEMTRRTILAATAVSVLGVAGAARAQKTNLKVIVFPNVGNIPIFAAQTQGLFARRGLNVDVVNTPNSDELRNGLAEGRYEIAHAAVDNAVHMAEVARADIAIVMGLDNGYNELIVQPEINSYEDLRGKILLVDAPDTAYALLLYKMLRERGLRKGDYVVKPVGGTTQRLQAMVSDKTASGAMINPPFTFRAEKAGLKSLGKAVDVTGPYQATGAWVMRQWARDNPEILVRYIQAYVEGWRWTFDPANKTAAIALLVERLKISTETAVQGYELAAHPTSGYAKDAKFDLAGFNNVLKLRAEMLGQWGGVPPAPEKYLDMSYYDRALAGL
jgi:ABC-type nitrate/sulfonate/bicarbonate transport system substrate-binding protein